MTQINKENIESLNIHYANFSKSARYRYNEDFYTDNNMEISELSYNENPLGLGMLAQKAITYHAKYAHLYPPIDYTILAEKIAQKQKIKLESVFLGAGAVSVIYHAIAQFTNEGDEVIFSKSSMPWYNWSVIANKAVSVQIPLLSDMNHDLERILETINRKTKIVLLSNPHNPTALYIDESKLSEFYNRIPDNVLLIIDQAYYEYQTKQETTLKDLIFSRNNILLVRTFSKIHGLAGLRIGYGMTNPENVKALKAKWLGTMPTISSIGTFAAIHALDDIEHQQKSYQFNLKAKQMVKNLATEYGIETLDSEANFITIKVMDSLGKESLFINEGIRLTTGAFFGYNEWMRMSFCKDLHILKSKLDIIFSKLII
jgi:histidinol-phosphate aminotransferase